MDAPQLWTRNFLIITLENFFVYFTYYLLIAIIAVYAADKFQASPSAAGLSASIFILGAIWGRLYAGSSIERVGHKKMLYLSFAFYLLTTLMYFLVNSLLLLIIIRLFHGAAFGMTSNVTGTIAAEVIPNERRGEGTGYYALSTTLAAAIGPFLGMFIIQHANFNINLIICAITIGVSFLSAFPLTVNQEMPIRPELAKTKTTTISNFFESTVFPISMVTALICFGYSSILSFLATYSQSINLIDAGSFFFIAYAAAILISRPFTGRMFDLKGENSVIYPTLLLFAIALVMLAEAHTGYTILLAGVILGFGYGNFFASAQALAVKIAPPDRKALATSTFFIFADVGAGLGPFLLGLVIPILNFRGLYLSMAVVVLAAGFLYFLIHGKKAGQSNSQGSLS